MRLEEFFEELGHDLKELLWSDRSQPDPAAELHQLQNSIQEVRVALQRERQRLDELQSKLHIKEAQTRALAEKVPMYLHLGDQENAWRHAMELDQQRTAQAARRTELRQQRQAYDLRKNQLEQLERRLAALTHKA